MVSDLRIRWSRLMLPAVLAAAAAVSLSAQGAAKPSDVLGTVRLSRATMADGQALAAGTYSVRVSDAAVTPAAGESAGSEKWVEFVQGGTVKGREIASVLVGPAVKEVAKGTPPASGQSRVEMLAGNEYLRVWINHGGTNYLVHLAVAPRK
jgi:hypothetical protein